MMKKLKKRLAGGHKIIIFFLFFTIFFCNIAKSSQILDFETETFINILIEDIKKVNNISKQIKYIILSDENINAHVDQDNVIYLNSGLIVNCSDYVALLSVIAHEIGHIDNNHVSQRKLNLHKVKNINNLTSISIIAGSLISNNPEVLQGLAVSSAGSSEYYINFTKNQEREADYYSIQTLSNLNIYSDSIIELLRKIEKKSQDEGMTREKLKVSTHPYFEERIEIINFLNEKSGSRFSKIKNNRFKFIQAKFLGYSENRKEISKLEEPYKKYALSILNAKEGKLKKSMLKLNNLISMNSNEIFLLETKADILFSYGYINESIRFYQKVLNEIPDNNYAQIRIFENIDINKLTYNDANILFQKNINLLEKYYNNKNLLVSYLRLVKFLDKDDWYNFLNFWLNKNESVEVIKNELNNFKTNDKILLNLIKIIYNNI